MEIKKINPKPDTIFRSKLAQDLFIKYSQEIGVFESGIDSNGKIYFAYLNGNVDRYTRKEFLKLSKENFN